MQSDNIPIYQKKDFEKMRKAGSKGAPTKANFARAAQTARS